MVPDTFRNHIESVPEELLNRKEFDIIKICYSEESDGYPPAIDIVLRMRFWEEYNRAQADERNIVVKNIFHEVCTHPTFYRIIANPKRLAYILTEPLQDSFQSKSILGMSWKKMRSIMLAEPGVNNKTGLTDTKLLDTQLKLFQYLDQRENGMLIQRIKQETTNTNVNVDANKAIEQVNTEEEVRRILEAVKDRLAILPTPPEPKLVLPVEQSHRDAGRKEPHDA